MCIGIKYKFKTIKSKRWLDLQDQNTLTRNLLIAQGVLAMIITVLMFYPMFGGTLYVFNGTFIYFSYFLALFLVVILGIIDLFQLVTLRKKHDLYFSEERNNYLVFIFVSLMIMIGLLVGHYVFPPLLGIIYIFLMIMQLFQLIMNKDNDRVLYELHTLDYIQRFLFYLTAMLLLVGNQPFEIWHIPITTTMLFVFVVVSILNFGLRVRKT